MPRIPIPEYQRREPALSAAGMPRGQPVVFSSAEGEALQRAGAAAMDYAVQYQQDANYAAATSAYTDTFAPKLREITEQYYGLQGKDALEKRAEVERAIQSERDNTRQSLNSAAQKLFDQFSRGKIESELELMARHAGAERRRWLNSTHTAALQNITNDAANAADEGMFDRTLQWGAAEIERFSQSVGATGETAKAATQEFAGNAKALRVQILATRDPLAGQALYQQYQADIPADKRLTIERQLQSLVLPVQAKGIADEAISGVVGSGRDVRASLDDAVQVARDRAEALHPGNPVFADLAVAQVKGHLATIAQAQEAKERQAADVVQYAAIGAPDRVTGRNTRPVATTLPQLLRDPSVAAAYSTLSVTAQRGVLGILKQNAQEAVEGRALKTDPKVFDLVWERMRLPDDDPRKIRSFNEVDPFLDRGLSRADYEFFRRRFDERRTESGQRLDKTRASFFDGMKGTFTKSSMTNIDAEGDLRFYNFKQYALEQEAAAIKRGDDPYELYSPTSPKFLAKQAGAFQASMDDQIRNMAKNLGGAAAPLPPDKQRRAGESVADYLKRTGGK